MSKEEKKEDILERIKKTHSKINTFDQKFKRNVNFLMIITINA